MKDQHEKISGYRSLSQEEIDLMNEIKEFGPALKAIIDKVYAHNRQKANSFAPLSNQPDDQVTDYNNFLAAEPFRWSAIAETNLQQGLMALTRAVAQPTFF